MAETMELLPCPFCGGVAAFRSVRVGHPDGYIVACTSDDCFCPQTTAIGDDAVVQWNTRATTPTGEELAVLLREFCEWRDRAQDEDDDCEYLNHDGFDDLDRLAERGRAILSRLPAAATSQSTERDRALEEAAQVAENLLLAVIPDQCSTRDSLKFQREKIAERIRAMKGSSPPPAGAE
jgi:hypothetical protein